MQKKFVNGQSYAAVLSHTTVVAGSASSFESHNVPGGNGGVRVGIEDGIARRI